MRQEPTPPDDDVAEPTPGEMLLRALGALWLYWQLDPEGSVQPHQLDMNDIETVARVIGVWSEVEHFQEGEDDDEGVLFLHMPSEVLVIDNLQEFPWKLLDAREWARRRERGDSWRRMI